MSEIASQITSLTIVYSTVLSGADQSKHQSSASLAFVWEIHRWPVNYPHKWPVTRKIFPFDDVIMVEFIPTNAGPVYVLYANLIVTVHVRVALIAVYALLSIPDSKVHGANMGPIWGRQDSDGPHVGPMNLVIWDVTLTVPLVIHDFEYGWLSKRHYVTHIQQDCGNISLQQIVAKWRIYASRNWVIIASDNCLSPVWCQAIIWTSGDLL